MDKISDLNNHTALIYIFIFIISFTIYANSLGNKFVFDDTGLVIENNFIKHIKTLPNIFKVKFSYFSSDDSNYYRPISILSYALDYGIWRLNPLGYHFTNILFHALNGFLLAILITILFGNFNLALLSSILFIIHPIHTSAVNFIACRDTLLSTFFGLLSIIYYLFSTKNHKRLYFILSLIFFFLSLLSRESMLFFVALIIICAIKMKESKLDILKKVLPFLITCVFYIFLRYYILKLPLAIIQAHRYSNLPLEILNFFNILFNYLKLLIFPFNQHLLRITNFINSLFEFNSIRTIIFIGALLILLIWSIKNKRDVIWFTLAWFIFPLLFIIKTMHLVPYLGCSMSEWWVYLASMGFFVILANTLLKLWHQFKIAFIIIFIGICFFWIPLTVYNNTIWKDELTLYANNLMISPADGRIRINLANVYLSLKKYDLAEREFHRGIELRPNSWQAYLGLGNILFEKNRLEEAIATYKLCFKSRPNCAEAWNNIGLVYANMGNNEAAVDSFFTALKYNPGASYIYENLGSSYLDTKDYKKAEYYFSKAIELNPEVGDHIYADLGSSYLDTKDYKKAEYYFSKAIELNPNNEIYFTNLGISYASQNLIKAAFIAFSEALKINPQSVYTMFNVGTLYAKAGNLKKAVTIWKKALALEPLNESIKNNIKVAERKIK